MNSMRRSDAIDRLEDYAFVIVEHLTLCAFFKEHSAVKHWKAELSAFKKALLKANKAGKRLSEVPQLLGGKEASTGVYALVNEERSDAANNANEVLQTASKGKNFGPEMVVLVLNSALDRENQSNNITDVLAQKKMPIPSDADWTQVEVAIIEFSKNF